VLRCAAPLPTPPHRLADTDTTRTGAVGSDTEIFALVRMALGAMALALVNAIAGTAAAMTRLTTIMRMEKRVLFWGDCSQVGGSNTSLVVAEVMDFVTGRYRTHGKLETNTVRLESVHVERDETVTARTRVAAPFPAVATDVRPVSDALKWLKLFDKSAHSA
jgi:hypothetical protein